MARGDGVLHSSRIFAELNRPCFIFILPLLRFHVRVLPRWLMPRNMKICYTVHGYAHTWSNSRLDRFFQSIERLLSARADITLFQSIEDLEAARALALQGRPPLFLGSALKG